MDASVDNIPPTSLRLDASWSVLSSHHTFEFDRCIDVFSRPDGAFGVEEFRRDSEDMGVWTPISHNSSHEHPMEAAAMEPARRAVRWFGLLSDFWTRLTSLTWVNL